MSADPSCSVLTIAGVPAPELDPTAFVAAGAVIVGNVRLAAQSSVWYNAVLRAEAEPITLGERSNLQDTVVCHVDRGYPLTIGSGVSVGHGAVLHGCTVEDDCLIGMAATVLNGAVIGAGSLVAAGDERSGRHDRSLEHYGAGVPAKVRRELSDDERAGIRRNAVSYLGHVESHTAPVD